MTAEPGSILVSRRRDQFLRRGREPIQSYPQERPGSRAAGANVGGKRGLDGRPYLVDDRAGRLVGLGRGQRRIFSAPGKHPQAEQVRLATLLVTLYLVGGRHNK